MKTSRLTKALVPPFLIKNKNYKKCQCNDLKFRFKVIYFQGMWLLLQNAHNAPHLLLLLESIMEECAAAATPDTQFRIWMACQAVPEALPVRMLQNSVKAIIDTPKVCSCDIVKKTWVGGCGGGGEWRNSVKFAVYKCIQRSSQNGKQCRPSSYCSFNSLIWIYTVCSDRFVCIT